MTNMMVWRERYGFLNLVESVFNRSNVQCLMHLSAIKSLLKFGIKMPGSPISTIF